MIKRIGNRTLEFTNQPTVRAYASVAGKKESEGPLGGLFDKIITDSYDGLDTYEDAESTEVNVQVTTSVSQGALRGMTLLGADQDASTGILTQVYAWKPAYAAASAGVAGAMNTPDATPGKPAPTGNGTGAGASGSSSAKGYESKTAVSTDLDEFL